MGRLVALLFLVQASLLGLSLGAHAEIMPRDQFGNVLCSPGADGTTHAPSKPGGHSSALSDCCTLGCTMFGGPLAPPPTPLSRLERRPLVLETPFVLFEGVGSGAVETPRNTRGPPARA
ncbi:DUF2946 family protein [Aureimonas pseudogalii]|uniref:DUF2946 domain-containing protein n=1 Tax=Aureimonas pseudogalii TaxID=1744844 RepID=A0A7W6H6K6_9HYPH|nr:DUF2946 family protein [Aureimonas pseudogalii]MBB3999486.1 hypothetical protein [Aureimonas pseudogalii]